MSRWRILLVFALFTAPVVFLAGLGAYSLYERQWGFVAWWPVSACFALALLLGWYWQRKLRLIGRPDIEIPLHWTERDRQAWTRVEERAQAAGKMPAGKFGDLDFYVKTAQEMAVELARAYHPKAVEPIGRLTIAEILTAVELAAHDLSDVVDQYLPGGHLLTIDQWRQARQAADWYQKASNLAWLVTAVFSPIHTGLRYAASRFGVSKPWQKLQENLLLWFYTAYVHRVGAYLIELHSGRLRVGAQRYRELVRAQREVDEEASTVDEAESPARDITITVLGQTKVGKSSFINALLGDQRARTDVVRATDEITRYQLKPANVESRLTLLDTIGYAHSGPKEDQLKATFKAAQDSDLLVLVLHARNPARQADVALLQALRNWFQSHPELKMPPLVGVLTHIDLLSPAMEWEPPYNWQEPQRPKEQQIHEALKTAREQMGEFLVNCVPMCTAPGKVYGLQEWFLPMLLELLDEARAVALLRCLHEEADADKFRKVLRQLTAAGLQAAKIFWQSR